MSEKIQVKETYIVKSVSGNAQVIDADGNIRTVHAGDKILPGETILTGDDGYLLVEDSHHLPVEFGQLPDGVEITNVETRVDDAVVEEKTDDKQNETDETEATYKAKVEDDSIVLSESLEQAHHVGINQTREEISCFLRIGQRYSFRPVQPFRKISVIAL